jgi:hypothetical protein
LNFFISEWRVIDNPIKGHQIIINNVVQDSAILDYELIKNGHPQMVDFGSGQGRSDIETGGVAVLRRGIQYRENTGLGRKMPFVDGR